MLPLQNVAIISDSSCRSFRSVVRYCQAPPELRPHLHSNCVKYKTDTLRFPRFSPSKLSRPFAGELVAIDAVVDYLIRNRTFAAKDWNAITMLYDGVDHVLRVLGVGPEKPQLEVKTSVVKTWTALLSQELADKVRDIWRPKTGKWRQS